jgi:hypothetical protein
VKRHIKVTIENREDGGANVSSEDLPGLILSGSNSVKILASIEPAARAILEHKGEAFDDIVIDACFVAPAQS